MTDEQPQKQRGLWRKTGGAAWRVLMPFSAMRGTYNAFRNEAQRNRENIAAIRELGKTARDALLARRDVRDQSFEEAMQNRAPGALPEADLYRFFLRRKRAAICAIFLFLGKSCTHPANVKSPHDSTTHTGVCACPLQDAQGTVSGRDGAHRPVGAAHRAHRTVLPPRRQARAGRASCLSAGSHVAHTLSATMVEPW